MLGRVCILLLLGVLVGVGSAQQEDKPTETSPAPDAAAATSSGEKHAAGKDVGDRNWHLRLGTINVGTGYFRGPAFYPYAPYGYWPYSSVAWWDPFWNPYWGTYTHAALTSFGYSYGKGEIRLKGAPKDAKVYLDGAYAGTADRLKHIWLDPGAYDLSVTIPGRETFQQRVYVLSGKTLDIAANQAPDTPNKERP